MSNWTVSNEYHMGSKVYVVFRENDRGQKEIIGTFDEKERAQEFADALNKNETWFDSNEITMW